MNKPKKRMNLAAFATEGSGHRQGHQVTLDEAIAEVAKAEEKRRGGRKAAFAGETVKVALFLPPDVAALLKVRAAESRMTPSALVAKWLSRG